ncbi:transcription elongation factor SPT6 isoform X1 [Frankliniella occidentalis]|uniref:Transcription elongation factor SPT6 n=1 Tax=Frankliniella occidentalis TaxID=133901 RepID=A0A6J1SU37_FRAOC|nr:transcription elongation factor SPT6 isoform X1 [Frankliniella occidentalis]XP_026284388.1 transcription elongation factor SPT6 isoform X1 [Frankliniella occidentalis]XP_026284389.1 transcription elongation factor SPT6 isoform X1 [Frankliniella occidentalis]
MSGFIDSEAEESEDEEFEKKTTKRKTIDSDDDDEDDDEGDGEDLKDLIDDNPIEESGDESDASAGSKKRKKSDDEDDLDDRLEDEDYDLLEENLGVKVERKKRFKRLKRITADESEDEQEEDRGDERDVVANELFEGSDNEADEREEDRSSERRDETAGDFDEEGDEEGDDYSDADDFIVDDEGRPITDKRKKRKPIFTDAALQEAQDIFGVDFDYDEFDKYDQEEEEYEEDEDYQEEDDPGRRRKAKKKAAKKTSKKSIFEIYEPSELKRGHFTDLDNQIRNTDIPERMQLRDTPVTPECDEKLEEEATWIYKQAFCKPSISTQHGLNSESDKTRKEPSATQYKIKKALDFMRNQSLEVPFIAFYRKEYVSPELTLSDLWKVYKYDEKWCQLLARKQTLIKLFEKMRDYQGEQLTKDSTADIPEDVRVLTDDDIDRVRAVQTPEELRDVHMHFLLYYSHEVPAMQIACKTKEKLERQQRKEAQRNRRERRKKKKTIVNDDGEEEEVTDEDVEDDDDLEDEEDDVEEDEPQDQVKQAVRSGPYSMCRKARLAGFAKRFGLSPEQFAENLRDNYQRHEVEQESVEPLALAKEYLSAQFPNSEEVLKAVKYMVAAQLSREPLVRKCVREALFERSKIDVVPTKKGIKEIDENHPIYGLKYLKGKPVRDLSDEQFLKLVMAEEEKNITISFSDQIEGLTTASFIEEAKQLYLRDEFIKHVQEWNTIRVECVDLALRKMLIPEIRKELKSVLHNEAKDCVLRSCCRRLYNWIKVSPYTVEFPDEDEDDYDTSKGLRVMGLAYVPDYSQAAFACIVAPDGEVTDYLRLPGILKRRNGYREDDKLQKEADLTAVRNFISTKKPHVIVVGGESRDALMVVQDLKNVVKDLVEDDQFPSINVEIVDNDLAKIFANSIKAENEFRDYPLLLRQAISLARRLQDPLIEYSQLCTSDEEILCLRFHPLQDQLAKEDLLEALYLEFVNRTNEVGVDINVAVQTGQTANLVQFICGLGPRKGTALIKLLKQTNQRLENRTQLVTSCHMGPKVFINCAGFIRIDTNSLGDSTEAYVEVLDGSRVHPEAYEWARKMAVDALEYDDEDANPAGALEEILESPERLKDLDLDAFAEELERQGFGNKSITLYDIRNELNHRYKDMRTPFASPNPEELFDILTKENPETFYLGKMILATVIGIQHRKPQHEQLDNANPVRNDETGLWQCPFCLKNDFPELSEVWNHFDAETCPGKATGVKLRLDNGIQGYIHIKNLSDKHVSNPEERVKTNQIIHCRITKIDVNRFSVECTSKSSDLMDANHEWRPNRDPYYDTDREAKDKKTEEDTKKMKQQHAYIKRVIVHPSFHNISFKEAEKLMATLDQGECIVRPSSKGADHLTVTWKVADNIYQHIDVREEGKENSFSLGQSLWIGKDEFEDLDEIIARHVNPMASHARDLISFKYYRETMGGKKDKAEEILKDEKRRNPSKIHYIISATQSLPGKFMLSYILNRCRHEYVTVTPDGFRFRQQMFENLNALFKWFKEHFRDPIPGSTPSTPRAGMTSRTPFPATPNLSMANIDPAIQRVAQSMPTHMLHSLSQVASQTPHYSHTPGVYGAASVHGYPNTPYTPSGQTPFMTPYATPHHATQTPRYGQPTPSQMTAGFLHPGAVTPAQTAHRTPSHRPAPTPTPHQPHVAHSSHSRSGTTPRYDEGRRSTTPRYDSTPRGSVSGSPYVPGGGSGTPRSESSRSGYKRYEQSPRVPGSSGHFSRSGTPRSSPAVGYGQHPRITGYETRSPHGSMSARSTPRTIASPESMVESTGDATPLIDEH